MRESNRGKLRIAETFTSRQGEGRLTGTPSFFVRTSGCNLRCWFCDTPYASWQPEGDYRSIDQLVGQARRGDARHVVITGGEPLLFTPIVELCQTLREEGFHVTIETAGTVDPGATCDLLSLSPKFASSTPDATEHPMWARRHSERRLPVDTMRGLLSRSVEKQIKFVVDTPDDFAELLDIVTRLDASPCDVFVMPQGRSTEGLDEAKKWLEPWCAEQGFQYCDRMQIRWYGDRRGT